MAEPFLAEIKMFGGNFAPRGYALCDGQLLPIAQNTAVFSLLGTTYGSNGTTTFGLPDMRGRCPVHSGQGPGLSNYALGQRSGEESHTLTVTEIPAHNHTLAVSNAGGNRQDPTGNLLATDAAGQTAGYTNTASTGAMAAGSISSVGGNQPHNNMPPYLCVNFIIALEGIFPSRN